MNAAPLKSRPLSPSGARGGFTLTEMSIASALLLLIFTAVAAAQLVTARTSHDLLGETRGRTGRQEADAEMRDALMKAAIGSMVISDAGRTLQFENPNFGGDVSEMYFENGTLFYDLDVADSVTPRVLVEELDDAVFEVVPSGRIVNVIVQNTSDLAYDETEQDSLVSTIHVRN